MSEENLVVSKTGTEILVIGAGPVGSYVSFLLAGLGYEVILLEEDVEVGKPLQCAGLVNSDLFNLPDLGSLGTDFILNNIIGADFHAPDGTILPLRGKEVKANVIDRSQFDRTVFKMAVGNQVNVYLGQKAVDVTTHNGRKEVKTKGLHGKMSIQADLIIGCDGTSSMAHRKGGFSPIKEKVPGINAEFTIRDGSVKKDIVGVFTGKDIAPGFFAWSIPTGDERTVRLGLSTTKARDLMPYFERFLGSRNLKLFLGITSRNCFSPYIFSMGTIPMGSPDRLCKDGILLLGDSAGMAKPTSGGGIFPGMKASSELADALDECGELEPGIDAFMNDWRKGYGHELEMSLLIRKMARDISDREINAVISKLKDDRIIDVINRRGDIDRPYELALELLRTKPSLMFLVPRYIPQMLRILSG